MRGNDGGAGTLDSSVRLASRHRRAAISRLRYIATWRAQVTCRRRLGETMSRTVRLKASATVCWISRIEIPREELAGFISRSPCIWISHGVDCVTIAAAGMEAEQQSARE